jgi:hypothetical protein
MKFEYLYLFITDCSVVELPTKLPKHVCIITRNEHKKFYGEYRQKLRDLRDLAVVKPKKRKSSTFSNLPSKKHK